MGISKRVSNFGIGVGKNQTVKNIGDQRAKAPKNVAGRVHEPASNYSVKIVPDTRGNDNISALITKRSNPKTRMLCNDTHLRWPCLSSYKSAFVAAAVVVVVVVVEGGGDGGRRNKSAGSEDIFCLP